LDLFTEGINNALQFIAALKWLNTGGGTLRVVYGCAQERALPALQDGTVDTDDEHRDTVSV
jgi:hypothetical protein